LWFVGDVMRSCGCAGGVIGVGDSVRLARPSSVAILFAEQALRIESHGELAGCTRLGKLAIAIDMPTSRLRK
jgi:hypothetical protein